MQRQGSRLEDLEAQIFGGGDAPGVTGGDIGYKNIKIARKILKKSGIRVVSEDVGGLKGRRLHQLMGHGAFTVNQLGALFNGKIGKIMDSPNASANAITRFKDENGLTGLL